MEKYDRRRAGRDGESEVGVIVNVPFRRGIIGELKLQRIGFVIDVKEFLKNLRWHGNASHACGTQSNLLYSARKGGR